MCSLYLLIPACYGYSVESVIYLLKNMMLLLLVNIQPQKIRPAIVANVIQPPLRCRHYRKVQIGIHDALCISLTIRKWLCDNSTVWPN